MPVDLLGVNTETVKSRRGLIFDSEGVNLTGQFNDELGVYRARKLWVQTLNNYFLLERERDYDMEIVVDAERGSWKLNCTFLSACGRYAFWRLINHQAPEAELRLSGASIGERRADQEIAPLWNLAVDQRAASVAGGSDYVPQRRRRKTTDKIIQGLLQLFR